MNQNNAAGKLEPLVMRTSVHGLKQRVRDGSATFIYRLTIILAYFLLLAPLALVIIMSFTPNVIRFPPDSFSLNSYTGFFADQVMKDALWVSIRIALLTTFLTLGLVGPASYAIDRYRFPGRHIIETTIMSSLLVPNMMIAIGFVILLSRFGIDRSVWQLAAAHMVISAPFTLRVLLASLATFDRTLEEASASLGARPLQTVRRVTIPTLRPGIIAAGILAFSSSFGNITASAFLSGVGTTTLPVIILSNSEFGDRDLEIVAVSTLVIVASVIMVMIIEKTTGLRRVF